MPSPFPGLDPWLEDPARWCGVHTRLITTLGDELVTALKPRYEVVIEDRIYVDHDPPEITRADVALVEGPREDRALIAASASSIVPVLVPTVMAEDVHERFLTIRSRDEEVVTVIEILSPTNKRSGSSDGRQQYLAKRERVLRSTAHLVEIDLLRAGERVPMRRPLPPASYYVIVSRAGARPQCEVYPIGLRDRLPPGAGARAPAPCAGERADHVLPHDPERAVGAPRQAGPPDRRPRSRARVLGRGGLAIGLSHALLCAEPDNVTLVMPDLSVPSAMFVLRSVWPRLP